MQNCRVHRLEADNLDRSVDDPSLTLLFREGWTVVCPIAVEESNRIVIALILAPPAKRNHAKVAAIVVGTSLLTALLFIFSGASL
jgi:hypothetical protein